jgi:hypothetical protein
MRGPSAPAFTGENTMTEKDRLNLAQAYMSAWAAAKHFDCVVNLEPHGWFEVRKRGTTTNVQRVRAARLLEGLVTLTARLKKQQLEKQQ